MFSKSKTYTVFLITIVICLLLIPCTVKQEVKGQIFNNSWTTNFQNTKAKIACSNFIQLEKEQHAHQTVKFKGSVKHAINSFLFLSQVQHLSFSIIKSPINIRGEIPIYLLYQRLLLDF